MIGLLFLITACTLSTTQVQPRTTEVATTLPPSQTIRPIFTPVSSSTPTPTSTISPTPSITPIFLSGAGDISICGQDGDDLTAAILEVIPGTIFTLGDNSNEAGRMIEYQRCFGPAWGKFLDRIRPSAGNHDYVTPGAPNYYAYFGASAGEPGKGYYSYDLGNWHIVVLNSNCGDVACGRDSKQIQWLKEDLKAHSTLCTAAYWHHPLWTSYDGGESRTLIPIWEVLYENGVDLVMNGDEHFYERFQPLNPLGTPDPARGIRQFTISTGGAYFRYFEKPHPLSETQITGQFGIMKFTLQEAEYSWEFINTSGEILDQGSANCH